jgi:N-acyl-D-aspartate/D-glutamate deacylase
MPAARFGFRDRGVLRAGAYADVVVFDDETLADGATLADPVAYCRGVEYVLVNGRVVVQDGQHTGDRPGRVLRYG